MPKKYNPSIVMSIEDTKNGIEINEQITGTLPELTTLLSMYLATFCIKRAEKLGENPRDILMAISLPALHNMEKIAKECRED